MSDKKHRWPIGKATRGLSLNNKAEIEINTNVEGLGVSFVLKTMPDYTSAEEWFDRLVKMLEE